MNERQPYNEADTRAKLIDPALHARGWTEDLVLTKELGVRYLRYGPPYYRIHTGAGKYDWSWLDPVMKKMRRLQLIPIIDLCHFGVPDWIGNFQNPDFPELLAEYALAFARRYPWVRLFTPVNEMYIAAEFSAFVRKGVTPDTAVKIWPSWWTRRSTTR